MAETVTILGLAELEKRLQALPEQIKRGGLILRALLGAAKIIRIEARKNAPVLKDFQNIAAVGKRGTAGYRRARQGTALRERGALRSGIVAQMSNQQELTAIVRVRTRGYIFAKHDFWSSAKRKSNPFLSGNPVYWWLLEFGTSKIPPMKFMRRAFESKKMQAAEQIKTGLANEINKANADPDAYALTQQRRRR